MVIMNVSGGGLRSATFTMNVLQKTDSLCGGNLMKKTVLITGASGGMLAAAYYRELYNKKLKDVYEAINYLLKKDKPEILKDKNWKHRKQIGFKTPKKK